ncbi:hypothetical protein SmJEL517_g00398 [Synchytrium microbalum]|uniref:FAD-binding FR-type domain-containing protein n=1 Tax=Synchytrium microbalum TaxID=1806994 RepID=A0A507CJL6_9FUNG|nr:uncharacterized protein SmJEL517_g00398 [Synchytrium microbalum]TPX38015.1 hypothetical protein SmJEL517_g00398 [Synchytrium microbalum]
MSVSSDWSDDYDMTDALTLVRYNFPAKKLYKRLAQLGARSILYRGDGNDQDDLGIDAALDPWLESLWQKVLQMFPLPAGADLTMNDNKTPTPSYHIQFLDVNGHVPSIASPDTPRNPSLKATVKVNSRITAQDHDQDTRHLIFGIDQDQRYHAGDVMVIRPQNLRTEVNEVITHFGWEDVADRPIQLIPSRADIQVPKDIQQPTTIRTLLIKHLDIFGRPRRYFFELASYFATNLLQAGKLREFASAAGQSDLYAYCHRMRRTTFEVLQDFASVVFPVDYLLDLMPMMRPRSFSIASSLSVHPGEIHLCVAIVAYYTRMKKIRHGVCTRWLSTLSSGDQFEYNVTKGPLKLPASIDTPVICVAPGTGIAPMRSLIEERIYQGAIDNVLFFGFRKQTKDFYYKSEFEMYSKNSQLVLFTAPSQDQDHKIYVQHRMGEQASLIWSALSEKNAYIFLSGSSTRIPKDVTDVLVQICIKQGSMGEAKAEAFVANLQKEGRYVQDCWA